MAVFKLLYFHLYSVIPIPIQSSVAGVVFTSRGRKVAVYVIYIYIYTSQKQIC